MRNSLAQRYPRGEASGRAKLDDEAVTLARQRYHDGESIHAIWQSTYRDFVTYATIYSAVLGLTWTHLPAVEGERRKPANKFVTKRNPGHSPDPNALYKQHGYAVLTESDVSRIRYLRYQQGLPWTAIHKQFPQVSYTTIHHAGIGLSWKHVPMPEDRRRQRPARSLRGPKEVRHLTKFEADWLRAKWLEKDWDLRTAKALMPGVSTEEIVAAGEGNWSPNVV